MLTCCTLWYACLCVEYGVTQTQTVQFLMIWYHLTFSGDEKALVYAWNLMGFAATLAQRVRTFAFPLFP